MSPIGLIVAVVGCAALTACEDATAKFHPGDVVMDKHNHRTQGTVYLRLKPFAHRLYYLKLQRSPKEIAQGASKTYVDGPWDEDQLELVQRR
jgi:hypothetical protein